MAFEHHQNLEGKSIVIIEDFASIDNPTRELFEGALKMIQESPHTRALPLIIPSRPNKILNQRHLSSQNIVSVLALESQNPDKV